MLLLAAQVGGAPLLLASTCRLSACGGQQHCGAVVPWLCWRHQRGVKQGVGMQRMAAVLLLLLGREEGGCSRLMGEGWLLLHGCWWWPEVQKP
jgi:hypothetical protein